MGLNPFHRAFSDRRMGKPEDAAHRVDAPKIVASLIKAGADVNAPDDGGETPLHMLAAMRDIDEVQLVALAGQLIKKGVKAQNGKTAADVATEAKREKLAAALK